MISSRPRGSLRAGPPPVGTTSTPMTDAGTPGRVLSVDRITVPLRRRASLRCTSGAGAALGVGSDPRGSVRTITWKRYRNCVALSSPCSMGSSAAKGLGAVVDAEALPHNGSGYRLAYAWVVKTARSATLTEVAQLAGVSLTTASRAVNGRDRISDTTRKRVLKAAKELAYSPNLVAKSLASGRSSIIGVLLMDSMIHHLAVPIVAGAQAVVLQREFSAIIADARGETGRLPDLAAMLRRRHADGLLVVGNNQGETPSITAQAHIPTVYVHGQTTNTRDVVHLVDDYAGAVIIISHLVELQRERMAHITGPAYSPAAQQRVLGVTKALGEHDLELVTEVKYGPWSQRWARQATREILDEAPHVDAIVCGSDQLAAAALEVVLTTGRRVPEDVAITGYDNWLIFANETDPALTTLDMNLAELGASAVSDLFAMIGGARVGGGSRYHEGVLVVRGSTDPRWSERWPVDRRGTIT